MRKIKSWRFMHISLGTQYNSVTLYSILMVRVFREGSKTTPTNSQLQNTTVTTD